MYYENSHWFLTRPLRIHGRYARLLGKLFDMQGTTFIPWIQVILALVLVAGVLLQQSEAGLGSSFGGGGPSGASHTKRGLERVLFIGTIVAGILFVGTNFVALTIR